MFSRWTVVAVLCVASAAGAEPMTLAVPGDYPSIQAAMDAASPGSTIIIEPGVYQEPLVIGKDLTLSGAESGEVVLSNTVRGGEIIKITVGVTVELQRLILEHSDREPENGRAKYPDLILVEGGRAHVRHCAMRNGAGCGIAVRGGSDVRVEDCRIEGNVQTGIGVRGEGARGHFARNVVRGNSWGGATVFNGGSGEFVENTFSDNPRHGIYIFGPGPEGAVIRGNRLEKNGGAGVLIEQRAGTIVEGNTVRENADVGIWACCGTGAVLRGNTIEKNTGPGIRVAGIGTNAEVVENACSGNKGAGILVAAAARAAVRGNTSRGNTANGIVVRDWFTSAEVNGNTCEENAVHGILVAQGASVSIAGNMCRRNGGRGTAVKDEGTEAAVGDNTLEANHEETPLTELPLSRQAPAEKTYLGWALAAGEHDYLENTLARLREGKCRDAEGKWQLDEFYEGLRNGYGNQTWQNKDPYMASVRKWCDERPDSVAARVLLAQVYENYAWELRGPGYGYEVTPEGQKGFEENFRHAEKVLEEAEPLAGNAPEFFEMWLATGTALGYSKEKQRQIFMKGVALAPDYFPMYSEMALFVHPSWRGSGEELVEFFAEARKLSSGSVGDTLYAELVTEYMGVFHCEYSGSGEMAEWTGLDSGFRQLLREFPDSKKYLNNYCVCACLFRQRELAAELFDRIGDRHDLEIWGEGDESEFEAYARWAREEGLPFPCEEQTKAAEAEAFPFRTVLIVLTVPVALSVLASLGVLARFAARALRRKDR